MINFSQAGGLRFPNGRLQFSLPPSGTTLGFTYPTPSTSTLPLYPFTQCYPTLPFLSCYPLPGFALPALHYSALPCITSMCSTLALPTILCPSLSNPLSSHFFFHVTYPAYPSFRVLLFFNQ